MNRLLSIPAALLMVATGSAVAPASATKPTPVITWSGYTWTARTVPGAPGVAGSWAASNISVDSQGRLHLRTTRDKKGNYTQAELDSTRKGWGYGTYEWKVSTDVSTLAPEDVLGLFTYGQDPAYGHREIDIEAAGWGVKPITWDYTTWADGHDPVARTVAPGGASIQRIDWQPGQLTWTSSTSSGQVIASATATGSNVPVPGDEAVALNLWVCGCLSGWNQTPATEVVISSFTFTPAA